MKSARANSPEVTRLPLRPLLRSARARARFAAGEWVAAAIVVVVALAPLPVAAKLVGLALAAVALVGARGRRRVERAPDGFVSIDGAGVARERGGVVAPLASWGAPFGVALVATEQRDRGLLAFTTPEHTRFVAVRAAGEDDARAARELFARAPTIPEADLVSEPHASSQSDALSAGDALRVLAAVRARDARAMGRILLTDSRGAPIVLEGDQLRAGDRVVDLALPLEWRAFSFVESTGSTASISQATWVRQSGVDVVLVAAMAEGSAIRDQAVAAPPPFELRVAVERLFMASIKDAIGKAPRASRAPVSTSRARGADRRA